MGICRYDARWAVRLFVKRSFFVSDHLLFVPLTTVVIGAMRTPYGKLVMRLRYWPHTQMMVIETKYSIRAMDLPHISLQRKWVCTVWLPSTHWDLIIEPLCTQWHHRIKKKSRAMAWSGRSRITIDRAIDQDWDRIEIKIPLHPEVTDSPRASTAQVFA